MTVVLGREYDRVHGKPLHEGLGKLLGRKKTSTVNTVSKNPLCVLIVPKSAAKPPPRHPPLT